MPQSDDRIMVLLLPEPLEQFEQRVIAEDLMQATGVVAVDPPRTSYRRLARIPDAFGVTIASKQARRLRKRLPGLPSGVTIFHPAQYPLARGLIAQLPECELWYFRVSRPERDAPEGPVRDRMAEFHALASERAAMTFVTSEDLGREEALAGRRAVRIEPGSDHSVLWDRLARVLGVNVPT